MRAPRPAPRRGSSSCPNRRDKQPAPPRRHRRSPSLSQIAAFVSRKERPRSRVNAACRSTGQGLGCNASTAARASAARIGANGGAAVSPAGGAVVTRMIWRASRWASAKRSPSAACRAGQSRAAAQPSSTIRTIGPVPARRPRGFNSGWAAAMITSAASTMRSRISHHGVRDGVSSRGASPSNSRIAGKAIRRGAGGVTRSSHQMIGNPASANSSQGEAKAREPSASTAQRPAAIALAKNGLTAAGRPPAPGRAPAARARASDRCDACRKSSRAARRWRRGRRGDRESAPHNRRGRSRRG